MGKIMGARMHVDDHTVVSSRLGRLMVQISVHGSAIGWWSNWPTEAWVLELVTGYRLTDKREKEALEALAEAQGRSLSELLRGVTHDLVATLKAGRKVARAKGEV